MDAFVFPDCKDCVHRESMLCGDVKARAGQVGSGSQMAASILYIGQDECNRVQVLRSAGYSVRECNGVEDLKSALKIPPLPAAVLMKCAGNCKPAIDMVHTAALAPVIIFPNPDNFEMEEAVDLVVPPLTLPAEWLRQLAALIEKGRALKEDAISLQERSATLIQQSIAIRTQSAADRASRASTRELDKGKPQDAASGNDLKFDE